MDTLQPLQATQAKPSALAAFARLQQTTKAPEQNLTIRPSSAVLQPLGKPVAPVQEARKAEEDGGKAIEKDRKEETPPESSLAPVEAQESRISAADVGGQTRTEADNSDDDDDFIVLESDDDEPVETPPAAQPVESPATSVQVCSDLSSGITNDLYDDHDVAPGNCVQPPPRER